MADEFKTSQESFQAAVELFDKNERQAAETPKPEPTSAKPPEEPEAKAEEPKAVEEPEPVVEGNKIETPELIEIQKKIKAAEREAKRERDQREYWFKVAQEALLKSQLEAKPASTQTPADDGTPRFPEPEPALEQFPDFAEYNKAWNRWDRKRENFETNTRQFQQQQLVMQQQKQEFENRKMSEGRKSYSDFEDVANDLGDVVSPDKTPAMYRTIFDSELFPDLVYKLGNDLPEAERISKLHPREQIFEIVALERKIRQEAINLKKKESQAPPMVEKPGAGIPKPQAPTLTKLFEKAAESRDIDDWARYVEARKL